MTDGHLAKSCNARPTCPLTPGSRPLPRPASRRRAIRRLCGLGSHTPGHQPERLPQPAPQRCCGFPGPQTQTRSRLLRAVHDLEADESDDLHGQSGALAVHIVVRGREVQGSQHGLLHRWSRPLRPSLRATHDKRPSQRMVLRGRRDLAALCKRCGGRRG